MEIEAMGSPDVDGFVQEKVEICELEDSDILKEGEHEKDDHLSLRPSEDENCKSGGTQLSPNAKSFSISSLLSNG